MSLFETHDVVKEYRRGSRAPVRALDGVSLAIARGSFVLLTGPSGSGKTTLLSILGALERPTRGRVLFAGRDLGSFSDAGLARVRQDLGMVFQDFALIPGLPVWENITYPLVPRGVRRGERLERAQALLAGFGLEDRLRAVPEALSGGEQQRVALARALVREPTAVLADEPTSNLDPGAAASVVELFRRLHAEGKTLIVSAHDPRFVPLADVTVTLEAGRLTNRPAARTA